MYISKNRDEIASMFDDIANNYDKTCHRLSFGIDKIWRNKFFKLIKNHSNKVVLDIATGTGEVIKDILKTNPQKIVGIDISNKMLDIARMQIKNIKNSNIVELINADVNNLPFDNNTFDLLTIGYGIRNFENLENAISEIYRVLKPEGKYYIIELTKPNKSIRWLYLIYLKHILPIYAKLLTKNKSAYIYLNNTINDFPQWENLNLYFGKNGFKNIKLIKLSFGIATIYIGEK